MNEKDIYMYPAQGYPDECFLRSVQTEYPFLRYRKGSTTYTLSVVATTYAVTGVGGQPRVRKGGTTYALYVTSTSNPAASPVRVRLGGSTYAIKVYQS